MARRLNAKLTYNLFVQGVEPGNQFQKFGQPHYVHVIFFKESNGEVYRGEYITLTPTQNIFVPGVRQPFKVTEAQDKGDVIVPLLDYEQVEEKRVIAGYLPTVTGESYSCAIMVAKDLLVASKPMQDIIEADITTMLERADVINEWLVKKQTDKIISL